MTAEELLLRQAVVSGFAVIYWASVLVQGHRIRKRIGRSPNLKPRDARERLLWAGWLLVVFLWIVQPMLVSTKNTAIMLQMTRDSFLPLSLVGGIGLTVAGYAATIWCYVIMGNAWRIGINRQEKNQLVTAGPYRWIRHPIYAFQTMMLFGAVLLLPAIGLGLVVVFHLILVLIKSRDEEAYLLSVHGDAYRDFMARTGRLLPKIFRKLS